MSDEISYDDDFFNNQSPGSIRSARKILKLLAQHYDFSSVLDVGCGIGTWLSACEETGIHDVFGVDGEYIRPDRLLIPNEKFQAVDLNQRFDLDRKFDLVMSLEVAEHLSSDNADAFVTSITSHGDAVLFSAAIPRQGGTHHINEQWSEYWLSLFESKGFEAVDFIRDVIWNDAEIPFWYRQNICFFRRSSQNKNILPSMERTSFPSRVHPYLYIKKVKGDRKEKRRLKKAFNNYCTENE